MFPKTKLTDRDIISSWAGLRPLLQEQGKTESEISRRDEIFESESRLISIAGGKLTAYRKMAERVVDLVIKRYPGKFHGSKKCITKRVVINGGEFKENQAVYNYIKLITEKIKDLGLSAYDAWYLVRTYGRQSDIIIEDIDPLLSSSAEIALIKSELKYCIHNEAVYKLVDFYLRRTGRMYFDPDSVTRTLPYLIEYFQGILSYTDEQITNEKKEVEDTLNELRTFK